jgi:universal stress protein E
MTFQALTNDPTPESSMSEPVSFRRILVIVDPTTDDQPAVQKAARVAAASGARVELYVCDIQQQVPESWSGPSRSLEYREMRRQRMLEDLQRRAQPYRALGLTIDVACEWHAPLEEGIGHHVIRSRPDLVIKTTHRHPAAPRVKLTRTDWTLIRQVPAPLLLVGPQPWPVQPRVAAAVDAGMEPEHPLTLDTALVDEARDLATALGGAVEVFHVLQAPPHLPGDAVSAEQLENAHASGRLAAERLARRCSAVAARFTAGRVVDGLAALAREHGPSVLAMGAVARPRWVHSAASGTAAQMLERVDCDLLVVKPPGFVSPLLITEE